VNYGSSWPAGFWKDRVKGKGFTGLFDRKGRNSFRKGKQSFNINYGMSLVWGMLIRKAGKTTGKTGGVEHSIGKLKKNPVWEGGEVPGERSAAQKHKTGGR